ncbi:MAG TPA: PPOX class F420-dependent oxidoreductase [Thermodesulfobacteriota bacterium]|nr:PPOX class F420-dependent oxidoreductase [Thermodesulfobacteriota bacterium]
MSKLNNSMIEFLNGRHYATLATLNDDGSIYLTPVWYLFEGGRFYVETSPSSRKARNVLARPQASIVVDSRRRQGDERWVSASGRAEVISGERFEKIAVKILERYITKTGLEDPNVGPGFSAGGGVAISITPRSWGSWEFKDLDDQYFGGILRATPEKWFHQVD